MLTQVGSGDETTKQAAMLEKHTVSPLPKPRPPPPPPPPPTPLFFALPLRPNLTQVEISLTNNNDGGFDNRVRQRKHTLTVSVNYMR